MVGKECIGRKGLRLFARSETGSLTIFSLFMFVLILMVAGLAIDMVRHERERVAIQNTLDSAVLAAGSLGGGATTEADMEAMVMDYVTKAGLDPAMFTVSPSITSATNRSITAEATFRMDTMFMDLMGIDVLHGRVAGGAEEVQQKVEIVLVLDVSGSMARDGKIEALRPAAKDFVSEMIARLGADRVTISVVPYNHQVHLDDELRARINWNDPVVTVPVSAGAPAGALTSYATRNPASRCARFRDADFGVASLVAGSAVEASAMFSGLSGRNRRAFAQYPASASWCSQVYAPVFLYQNDETALHTFIDTLRGEGWTSIDYGMNWGVGLLDGAGFGPIVTDMVDDGVLPAAAAGQPAAFQTPDVQKVIVLMTDGMNTDHLDLRDGFKAGPTRIWYSESRAAGTEFNGFLVEMPDNAASQRWFVPGDPSTAGDDGYLAETALPADAVQWDRHRLYDRFRPEDVADYFFTNDAAAALAHDRAVVDTGSYGTADARVRAICGQARTAGIDVYTIAFQAPSSSQTLLQDCAMDAGRYFDVNGLDIATAFNAIAVQLTKLRLTQ